MQIQTGDASVGGTKAWITSEFAVAMQLAILTLLYGFFLAVAAGMAIIQDDEWRLGDLLHVDAAQARANTSGASSRRSSPASWPCSAIHLAAMIFFNHVLPNSEAQEIRGPFQLLNYLRPALLFSLPTLVFLAGASLLPRRADSRRPILVFLLPLAVLMVDVFFLWTWSPSWLDPRINRVLMWLDPAGFRWLNETWLKVDRGAVLQHGAASRSTLPSWSAGLAFVLLGLAAVALSRRHFAATLRGRRRPCGGRNAS